METVLNNLDSLLSAAGGIVIAASLVTAHTRTPAPDTVLGKIYKGIELLALVYGKVKESSAADSAPKA